MQGGTISSNPMCSQADAEQAAALGCSTTATVESFGKSLILSVSGLMSLICVIALVVAGIKMMTAQGDPGKFAKARNAVIFAALGLVVAVTAWIIVKYVLTSVQGTL